MHWNRNFAFLDAAGDFLLKQIFAFFLILAAGCVFFACSERAKLINIPADSEQTLWGEWIVVSTPYAKCFDAPNGSTEQGYVRIAEIYEVDKRKFETDDNETNIWYKLEKGWISGKDVRVFSTFSSAETASKELKKK